MKIQLVSDLHLEFHQDKASDFLRSLPIGGDVLVIAGDFALFRLRQMLHEVCLRFPQVVFVAGNHEYYRRSQQEVQADLEQVGQVHDNFHWLERSSVELEGQRFVGTTLWFPDHPLNVCYEKRLTDFRLIPGFKSWVYDENEKSRIFLQQVRSTDVVITHHVPSYACVARKWRGSDINRFFVCSWAETIIRENKPAFWLCGHQHDPIDRVLGQTRVLSNPYGYEGEDVVTAFRSGFTFETG